MKWVSTHSLSFLSGTTERAGDTDSVLRSQFANALSRKNSFGLHLLKSHFAAMFPSYQQVRREAKASGFALAGSPEDCFPASHRAHVITLSGQETQIREGVWGRKIAAGRHEVC